MCTTLVLILFALLELTPATTYYVSPVGGGSGTSSSDPATLSSLVSTFTVGESNVIRMLPGSYTIDSSISVVAGITVDYISDTQPVTWQV
jgi:hypothetical protein